MTQRNRSSKISAAKIARGAVISALGAALLLISYFLESLDLVVASLAAILVWIVRIEYGSSFSLMVYLATSLIAFILSPGASGVICYGLIFGWYPIVKVIIEQRIRVGILRYLLKMLVITLAFALMITIFFNLFIGEQTFESVAKEFSGFFSLDASNAAWLEETGLFGLNRLQWIFVSFYLVFAPLMALIYDLLLSKIAPVYLYKIRPIMVKAHIFGDKNGKY